MTHTLSEWLQVNDLQEFEPILIENEVDLKALLILSDADLKELGLAFGPRKRILNAIKELKSPEKRESELNDIADKKPTSDERRQLTVMFCDLVGSTTLSTLLDPEELRELIQNYRKVCREVLLRYDGYIAQYLGDGMMIYFGWPNAHEDAAERGVRSALEMVKAIQNISTDHLLASRIGLATGTVVISGSTENDAAGEKTVLGDVPNLAARLQSLADPHQVVIAPTTRRLLGDLFSLTDLGEQAVKGITELVHVWRVDEVRRSEGRFQVMHRDNELTPMIGREREAQLLVDSWQKVIGGEGQVVLIGGQAGIGKSHLTEVLRKNIIVSHTEFLFQCSAYYRNSPLYPFIDQLERSADFEAEDSAEIRLMKLEKLLETDLTKNPKKISLFASLLSLPTDRYPKLNLSPRRKKEETLDAWVDRLDLISKREPGLMVVEDAHWIDPTSQELLGLIVQRIKSLPVLLIITYRPEYEFPWEGSSGVTNFSLNRLGPQEGAQLIETLAKGKKIPADVVDEILSRADGVPLFVEELTRSVLESGVLQEEENQYILKDSLASLSIPISLRDSLIARLDHLGIAKELAQIGACIGREFSYDFIKQIALPYSDSLDALLEKLVSAGLVTQRDKPPDAVYTFKHALMQDAAYDSMLKSKRVYLHSQIVDVLENDFVELVENKPELLAQHLTRSGQLAKAITFWGSAGKLAIARVALKEAEVYFQKGLKLVNELPPSDEVDLLELSIRKPLNAAWTGLRGWAAPEVGMNAVKILWLSENQKDNQSQLLAMWWMWTSAITQGRIIDSLQWVERLHEKGEETGDLDLKIFAHATSMVQCFLRGELTESLDQADKTLSLYEPQYADRWIQMTGHDLRTFIEVYKCQLLWMLGYPDQARQLSDISKAHAHSDGHPFNLVWALTFSAYVFAYRREPDRFLERINESKTLAAEQGITFILDVSLPQAQGVAALQSGNYDEAIPLLKMGIDRWTKTGGNVRVPYLKSALAEAFALYGDYVIALELINECLEQVGRPAWQESLWLAEIFRIKGSILILLEREEEAEKILWASIDCAISQNAKSWELRSTMALARLLQKRGKREESLKLLTPIFEWFSEGFETKDLMEAKELLETLASR